MSEQQRAYWDGQADDFDDEPDHGLRDPAVRAAWRELLRAQLPAAPADVVDLGCGTGTLSVLLGSEGHRVAGVDISHAMLRRARAKAAAAEVRVQFVRGDAADPPYAVGRFDVVLSRHVLWALPDPAQAVRRWTRLLRPQGRLVLVEGSWTTGAGLTAAQCAAAVRGSRTRVAVRHLTEPALWGGVVEDERYLVVSTS